MKVEWRITLIAMLAASVILSACASPQSQPGPTAEPTSQKVSLDLPPVEGLPDYAYRSAAALRSYQIAVVDKELLARLPCYCGCGQDPQYQNLRDCFLDDRGQFRSHGANCDVCQEEAQDAATWKAQGTSVKEIRARIDKNYAGRGKPTDTPPVTE